MRASRLGVLQLAGVVNRSSGHDSVDTEYGDAETRSTPVRSEHSHRTSNSTVTQMAVYSLLAVSERSARSGTRSSRHEEVVPMPGWQPGSPGIWIGEGTQRLFAAQAPGQWILRDVDGVELRRSRTLVGLVAELGPIDSGQNGAAPSWVSSPGSSRNGSVISRSDTRAARSCARRSGPRWFAHSRST